MFQKFVLLLGCLIAAYISVRALTAPEAVLENFGLLVEEADGRNEIRGQYGGFFGAVGVALALSLSGRLPVRFGLGVMLVTIGGVLMGRLLSVAIEGPSVLATYSSGIKAFILVDILLVGLTLAALWRRDSEGEQGNG